MTARRPALILSLALIFAPWASPAAQDDDPDDRFGLADLAAYRAALSGRATADDGRPSDPPIRAGFRDLWGRPDAYRGRRVTVVGRLERTFRQPAVGSFPPLAESWIFSTSGDPLCIVYPRPDAEVRDGTPGRPAQGRMVRFTGTFLKAIRYAAGDGDRVAPLIVGDRPPEPTTAREAASEPDATAKSAAAVLRAVGGGEGDAPSKAHRPPRPSDNLALAIALAAVAALALAGQHLRGAYLRRRTARVRLRDLDDPPLHFVDLPDGR